MSEKGRNVVDVTDADFERVVIQGSAARPVVVDMWAAWCGPCRTLGPILEKVAEERDGAFLLAKLDVDANAVGQELLGAVQSQGIPTVVAFRDGTPVSMFIGAYPEQEVNRFVDSILPSEAELAAEDAQAEAASGDLEAAERDFREALEKDPGNPEARVGLADLLSRRGEYSEAEELVRPVLPDPAAERVMARVRVASWSDLSPDGTLASAKREASAGRWRDALDALLQMLPGDPQAREAMVDVFAVLGDEDPIVPEYRRKLANTLF
jgi:putative thioredoxin